MAKKSKKPTAKRMGRPPTRGPTVPVAFRLSRDLSVRIDALRRRAKRGLSRTEALERVIRAWLEKEQAQYERSKER